MQELAAALGARDPEPEGLVAFAELVALWNRRLNLVGSDSPRDLAEVLFADALILAQVLPEAARFVDVGAGAGAPAIPLALLRPDLRATLVEPRRKRVAFQRNALGTLGLTGRASVLERRLEGPPIPGAPFDVAMSRATFEPAEWLERARGLAPRVIVLAVEELPAADGYALADERSYRLPWRGRPRRLGLFEAVSNVE